MTTYATSPLSSLRDESVQGTPYTAYTAFSPEDVRVSKSSPLKVDHAAALQDASDPFVTSVKQDGRLSAAASSFQPFSTGDASLATGGVSLVSLPLARVPARVPTDTSPTRKSQEPEVTQFGTFTTNTLMTRNIKVASVFKVNVTDLIITTMENLGAPGVLLGSTKPVCCGDVAYIRLSNILDAPVLYSAFAKDHNDLTVDYVSPNALSQVVSPEKGHFRSAHEGQVVLRVVFPPHINVDIKNLGDTMRQLLAVEGDLCAWQKRDGTEAGVFELMVEFTDVAVGGRAVERLNGKFVGDGPERFIISVAHHAPDRPAAMLGRAATTPNRRSGDSSELSDEMRKMGLGGLSQNPDVGHYFAGAVTPQTMPYMPINGFGQSQNSTAMPMNSSFSPARSGTALQQSLYSPGQLVPYQTTPYMYHPGYSQNAMVPYTGNAVGLYNPLSQDYRQHGQEISPTYYRASGVGQRQNGGRQMSRYSDSGNYGNGYGLSGNRNNRNNYNQNNGGQHNHVDVGLIMAGGDVRTTVMLRNIPNKVDQAALKELVDESSFGKYDFMYLRIDFSNNCNVGYAFINFVDPVDIIEFVQARANQRWQRFKSDKVAEVSYATIQGRDCLIQKFRNSSVMLETSQYRPKLFYTLEDGADLAGHEEDFPMSDNASKLKRSCENAEHVGLFAPNASQSMRDEQRRRTSQYDRGTSLAEREEFYHNSALMYPYGYYS